MIPDSHSNTVYFSYKLREKYYHCYSILRSILNDNYIEFDDLRNTNDIWCRDYMPVQVTNDKFVLFNYSPDYLKGFEKSITDNEAICKTLGINYIKSPLKIDGGNIVRSANKVILTDKIFKENPKIEKKTLIEILAKLFETENIIIIPAVPYDKLGHADGIVRFLDDNTVLVNKYQNTKESTTFQQNLFGILGKHGLNIIQIPYYPDYKKTSEGLFTAMGCYINYLQVNKHIFLPSFGNEEQDEEAFLCFERIFGKNVFQIDASEIALKGGVLNCISWNLYDSELTYNNNYQQNFSRNQKKKYVSDHVCFRLFEDEFNDIEKGFSKLWNKRQKGIIGDGDLKNYVYAYLTKLNRKPVIPQYVVDGVVDNLFDYLIGVGKNEDISYLLDNAKIYC